MERRFPSNNNELGLHPLSEMRMQEGTQRVGEFTIASMRATVYRAKDGRLFYTTMRGELAIILRPDGTVTVGASRPMEVVPSIKEALSRLSLTAPK